ncbi:MAG TPA: MarR family transcriptional regulator [Spirochaetia bacterium]|nr:MarR family transcriptional regulator [Spirochaetia bacterium]
MPVAERRFIDSIIELRSLCRFEEEIGEECGLAPREVSCLCVLVPGEEVTAGELAALLRLSASRASRLITSLRGRGVVTETFDARDRRAVSIRLTQAGERLLKKVELKKEECERRLLSTFNREQLKAVREGLATLSLAFQGGLREGNRDS